MLAALSREPVDRVPIDFCGHNDTTIHAQAYERLRAYLGLPERQPEKASPSQGTVYAAEELLLRYQVDTRSVHLPVPQDDGECQPDGSYLLLGADGSVRRKPAGGLYYDIWQPALMGELTSEAIARLPTTANWPDDCADDLLTLRQRARYLSQGTDYAVVLGGFLVMPVTGTQSLRGFEQWSVDSLVDTTHWQELIEAYMERRLVQIDAILGAVGEFIDAAYIIGDDMATQKAPWLRPSFYRQYIKPWHQRAMDFIRARTDAKVIFHICGAAREFIPDLIDVGVDAINPVQTSAAGMDAEALKRDFGHDIAFWGAVDTQHVLPFGSPDDVQREVERCVRALGPSGYVLASCHNIQADVPPENIEAMFQMAIEMAG